MGEKSKSVDSDERILATVCEVVDEWITKIRIEAQILSTASVVENERETSVVSYELIREPIRL
ncbi:MAG: hypothetical protein ACFFBJ_05395 [Promethearchaeota archaeon]